MKKTWLRICLQSLCTTTVLLAALHYGNSAEQQKTGLDHEQHVEPRQSHASNKSSNETQPRSSETLLGIQVMGPDLF